MFDWADYVNLAESMVRERTRLANDEACYRAAISRAYYGAFCAARNRARDAEGLTVGNTGANHNLVRSHFQRAPDRPRRQIGLWLDRLRADRNEADYSDRNIHDAARRCTAALAQARNTLNTLQTL